MRDCTKTDLAQSPRFFERGGMKKIILKIHEIIGLLTGVVVLIVSLTGSLWVFNEEINNLIYGELIVPVRNQQPLTPSAAKEIASKVFPGKSIHGIYYGKANEPLEVIFYEPEPEFYSSVYLDPYSGQILKSENHLEGFFAFLLEGHLSLWLPEEIGSEIVKVSVLLFMIALISGFYLWTKGKNKKRRLWFNWNINTRWKRKNYDLHSIIGFYIFFLAFIIAFTGAVMAYDWFYYIVYKGAGGEKDPRFIIPNNVSIGKNEEMQTRIDDLLPILKSSYPDADGYEIHFPHSDSASIYAEVYKNKGVYYNADYLFFDQYTLEEINTPGLYGREEDADFADSIIRMNYDVHVGAIGGIAGKTVAFFVSLFSASLPVTGFLLWLGKRKK
jgi:uncharacterized iron-regulated membrane protein